MGRTPHYNDNGCAFTLTIIMGLGLLLISIFGNWVNYLLIIVVILYGIFFFEELHKKQIIIISTIICTNPRLLKQSKNFNL